MIDPSLLKQAERVARAAAIRAKETYPPAWLQRLKTASRSPRLSEGIQQVKDQRWVGALPTWEPVDLAVHSTSEPAEVVGIDGAQIYPQEHSPVLWAYLQAIAYRKFARPVFEYRFYDLEKELSEWGKTACELCDYMEHSGELAAQLNSWRMLLEMRLARSIFEQDRQAIILFDNGLIPWLSLRIQASRQVIGEYSENLLAIRPGLIAGVIPNPQSRLLSRLVQLVEADTPEEGMRKRSGIQDATIMQQVLQPGERSAIFKHAGPRNELFENAGFAIYFFFLKTNPAEVIRVEIPEWVAREAGMVDRLQASLLADAKGSGYPFVLSQAHQEVAIPKEIGALIQKRVIGCYRHEMGQAGGVNGRKPAHEV